MSTATETNGTPKTSRPRKAGFAHRCPMCGASDSLKVELADVASLSCGECGDETSPAMIRRLIAEWEQALAWLESAPTR